MLTLWNLFSQIDDYSLVKFMPLDITEEDLITDLLVHIDNAIQYGEDLEPKEMPVSSGSCRYNTAQFSHFRVPTINFGPLMAKYLSENGVSGIFLMNYLLNSFHTWHLPLRDESLDPYTFSGS